MRRVVLTAALVVVVAALAPPVAWAADFDPVGTELTLNQTATRIMTPDRIRATLRIEVKGNDGRKVQADLNTRMTAALDKAKSVAAMTAATSGYAVDRDFNTKDREPWRASEALTLTSADFAAVLSLVGELQEMGLLASGVEFFLAPETLKAAESDLTATALAGLKARAEAVAKDLGMTLDHYKSISVGNASAPPRGRIAYAMAGANASAASPAPPPAVQADDATISLGASAVVVLVPSK